MATIHSNRSSVIVASVLRQSVVFVPPLVTTLSPVTLWELQMSLRMAVS